MVIMLFAHAYIILLHCWHHANKTEDIRPNHGILVSSAHMAEEHMLGNMQQPVFTLPLSCAIMYSKANGYELPDMKSPTDW